jgi:hypothetical protein
MKKSTVTKPPTAVTQPPVKKVYKAQRKKINRIDIQQTAEGQSDAYKSESRPKGKKILDERKRQLNEIKNKSKQTQELLVNNVDFLISLKEMISSEFSVLSESHGQLLKKKSRENIDKSMREVIKTYPEAAIILKEIDNKLAKHVLLVKKTVQRLEAESDRFKELAGEVNKLRGSVVSFFSQIVEEYNDIKFQVGNQQFLNQMQSLTSIPNTPAETKQEYHQDEEEEPVFNESDELDIDSLMKEIDIEFQQTESKYVTPSKSPLHVNQSIEVQAKGSINNLKRNFSVMQGIVPETRPVTNFSPREHSKPIPIENSMFKVYANNEIDLDAFFGVKKENKATGKKKKNKESKKAVTSKTGRPRSKSKTSGEPLVAQLSKVFDGNDNAKKKP